MTQTGRMLEPIRQAVPIWSVPEIRLALDQRLAEHLDVDGSPWHLMEAARHAVLAPGKRIRPVVLALVCLHAPLSRRAVLDAGCALEMVHAASLILDDLPCMDDATLRRNRPATHIAFGQATAILGAIGLLNAAFGLLAALEGVPDAKRSRVARILSGAVGWEGLVAGQELDVNGQDGLTDIAQVERLNWLKTGVLFVAAIEIGAVLADLSDRQIECLRRFATNLGQAFQMADDLLDKTGSMAGAGKDVGQDGSKTTVINLLGVEGTAAGYKALLDRADAALLECGLDPAPLRALVADLFKQRETTTA
jgi:geranylgeranyl diphosphate synthase, type II